MIRATLEEKRAMCRLRISKKKVVKGLADKMVEIKDLPIQEPEVVKNSSATIQLIRKVKELSDLGFNQTTIAEMLEREESWVRGSLLIATKLPEKAQQAIYDNKFSRTTALQLLLVNPDKLDIIIDGALILAETEGKL